MLARGYAKPADLTLPSAYVSSGCHALLVMAVLLLVSACSSDGDNPEDPTANWSAQKLYEEARAEMLKRDFFDAVEYYEKLDARYPYGAYAQQVKLDLAYCYYKTEQPELALEAADRFIKLYPLHEGVDYAYYLKGLVHFKRDKSIFELLMPQDPSQRDVQPAREAFESFALLLRMFPETKYADDARQRMVYLRNRIAANELHVARYYLTRGAYVAVANRAKHIVETYPRTPVVPEAMELMVKAYRMLNMDQLADDSLRVLAANYPDHPATRSATEFQISGN